jgi:hypothetical protein
VTAVVTAVVSAWTIVASLVFSQPTVQKLAFAGSLAIGGLAVVGLTVDELSTQSVAQSLETSDGRRDSGLSSYSISAPARRRARKPARRNTAIAGRFKARTYARNAE